MKKVARMPLVLDEMLTEIKSILSKLRLSEAATTRKVIITVGNSVLSALCPEKMAKNGGSITLSNKWPQNVLKSLDWLKQRGTTTKREMNPALYELLFRGKENQWKQFLKIIFIKKMILNFYQTPVGFTSTITTANTNDRSESKPITNVDDKRQISAIFVSVYLRNFSLSNLYVTQD